MPRKDEFGRKRYNEKAYEAVKAKFRMLYDTLRQQDPEGYARNFETGSGKPGLTQGMGYDYPDTLMRRGYAAPSPGVSDEEFSAHRRGVREFGEVVRHDPAIQAPPKTRKEILAQHLKDQAAELMTPSSGRDYVSVENDPEHDPARDPYYVPGWIPDINQKIKNWKDALFNWGGEDEN